MMAIWRYPLRRNRKPGCLAWGGCTVGAAQGNLLEATETAAYHAVVLSGKAGSLAPAGRNDLTARTMVSVPPAYDPIPEGSFEEVTGLTSAEWKKKCKAWCLKPTTAKPKLKRNLALLHQWGLSQGQKRKVVRGSMALSGYTPGSIQRKLMWMTDEIGFSRAEVMNIIFVNPSHLNYSVDHKIKPFLALFVGVGYNREDIRRMILKHPVVLGFSKNLDKFTEFLKEILGLSKWDAMHMIMKFPSCLGSSIEKSLVHKVDFLLGLGLSKEEAGSILRANPQVLGVSLEQNANIKIEKLVQLGLSKPQVAHVIKGLPSFLWRDFNATISSKLEWFQAVLNMSKADSIEMLIKAPRVFGIHLDAWEATKQGLCEAGSLGAVCDLLKKNPQLLSISDISLRNKIKFAQSELKKSSQDILDCPEFLLTSLEGSISLRTALVKDLGMDPSTFTLGTISRRSRFIKVVDESELDAYERKWRKQPQQEDHWM